MPARARKQASPVKVAIGVVEAFEMVNVKQDECERCVVTLRAAQLILCHRVKAGAVGQASQPVGDGQALPQLGIGFGCSSVSLQLVRARLYPVLQLPVGVFGGAIRACWASRVWFRGPGLQPGIQAQRTVVVDLVGQRER